MSKSSTFVTRKALKLDDKVKAINLCNGGKSCQAVAEEMGDGRTQIMNILKRKRENLDNFENNVSSSTSCYWKLYFCFTKYLYFYILFKSYHIEKISSTINVKSNIMTETK
jgi:hypothetical protein